MPCWLFSTYAVHHLRIILKLRRKVPACLVLQILRYTNINVLYHMSGLNIELSAKLVHPLVYLIRNDKDAYHRGIRRVMKQRWLNFANDKIDYAVPIDATVPMPFDLAIQNAHLQRVPERMYIKFKYRHVCEYRVHSTAEYLVLQQMSNDDVFVLDIHYTNYKCRWGMAFANFKFYWDRTNNTYRIEPLTIDNIEHDSDGPEFTEDMIDNQDFLDFEDMDQVMTTWVANLLFFDPPSACATNTAMINCVF